MDDDRRTFLKRAGGVGAAVTAGAALVNEAGAADSGLSSAAAAAAAAAQRSYARGRFAVELDGVMAGWLHSAEGGDATADVVVEKLGADNIQRKHIGNVKYEDISITCGSGMSKGFFDWIKASFDHKHVRKDGAIVAADYNFHEMSSLSFFHALITEVGFPALDAASKEAVKMHVKFAPEYTRLTFGGGGKIQGTTGKQDRWLASNFKLDIEGLDTTHVNKIEALVIKQKVTENPVGEQRDYQKEPANLEVPNLIITFPESHAMEFRQWHEDFVIKGNSGEDKEKGGTLKFLAPNLQDTLFTLSFFNLGIFKLAPEPAEGGSARILRLRAEMYCEEIKFDHHATFA